MVTQNTILNIVILRLEIKAKIKKDDELNNIYSKELLDFLFIRPFYTYNDMSKYLNNHRNTSSTYLKLLESK
jgi:hypothetical protein